MAVFDIHQPRSFAQGRPCNERDLRSRTPRREHTAPRSFPGGPSHRSGPRLPHFPRRLDSRHPPAPTAAVGVCRSYTESVRALALNSESAPARVPKHHPFGPPRPRVPPAPSRALPFRARDFRITTTTTTTTVITIDARAIGCRPLLVLRRVSPSAGCHRVRRICPSSASCRSNQTKSTRDSRARVRIPREPVE